MASRRDDDQRGKRKMDEPCDKQAPCHGRGRTAASSSSATTRDVRDKGRRDQLIQEEENLERADHTIPPSACPDTPPHLEEYDGDYITDYTQDMLMRCPDQSRAHLVIDYVGNQKMVEEAHDVNPFEKPKDLGIDYRFWNEFHSNFYALVIFNSKKSKIVKM